VSNMRDILEEKMQFEVSETITEATYGREA